MDDTLRKSLEKYHTLFRSKDEVKAEVLSEYEVLIKDVLKHLID